MITDQTNYTDEYGITHESPVFQLTPVRAEYHQSINMTPNSDGSGYAESSSESYRVNYSVNYWSSKKAKDDGSRPLKFFNKNGDSSFSFSVEERPADVVSAAESHFMNEVL